MPLKRLNTLLFNSLHYFSIILILVPLYWLFLAKTRRLKEGVFILLGLLFYGEMNPKLSLLLLFTATVDYFLFQKIYESENKTKKRLFLIFSMLLNFSPLLAFKLMAGFEGFGLLGKATAVHIPIGISFYTFKSVGALIDVYHGKIDKPTRYLDFLFFVTYFPALLCGPVSRYNQFSKNFDSKSFKLENLQEGLFLILRGSFKKICIADGLYALIQESFNQAGGTPGFITSWAIISGHLVQVYFDFAGYTDIARGTAKLFGHELIKNFNLSLIQTNIGDFWRKHHISMTEWFRDYIYLPLLKISPYASYPVASMFFASTVTFFISGLWHNFGLNGVIFGVGQGLFLSLYNLIKIKLRIKIPTILAWPITFMTVAFSTHFILATNDKLLKMPLKGAFSLNIETNIPLPLIALQFVILVNMYLSDKGFYQTFTKKISQSEFIKSLSYGAWATAVIIALTLMGNEKIEFIYYRF